ncbi:glycosyltransferase family A protein [Azospirillum sp.]|uniref:glycosyltransferase family 2 protein n=1 Tax=Azospirillum sp. TaxID=34012 RepID=UPI002D5CD414|nr:glycosyltransferase family A protein [Azospirillum sp.]HYF84962.1 glycosyltransferase family A protein [Azospirillum sp.]
MAPRVSVLLPAWNTAAYVEEAVESILAQTYGDFELLVLDDGSTDGTADRVLAMRDSRLKVFRNPVQLGLSGILNVGLALAEGEYVARMDSDDISAPDRLALQVAVLDGRPEVTVCGADLEMFGDATGASDAAVADCDIKALFLEAARNVFDATSLFRREFVMKNRIRWNQAYVSGGDLAFWIDFMRAGAVFTNVKKPLLRYRRHPTALSRNVTGTASAVYRIRKGLIADFYPHLTQMEGTALANLLAGAPPGGGSFSFPSLCEAVASATKAKRWTEPVFGESRSVLDQIVDNRVLRFQQAILRQP